MQPEHLGPVRSPRDRRSGFPLRDVLTAVVLGLVILAGVYFWLQERRGTLSEEATQGGPEALLEDGPPVEQEPVTGASEAELDAEARRYVDTITRPAPLSVDDADKFVRRDQVLSLLPQGAVETVKLEELLQDPNLEPGSPITVVRQTEHVEAATAERLAAEAGLDLERRFRLREDGEVREVTARELLARYGLDPAARVEVVDAQGNALDTAVEALLREAGLDSRRTVTVLENDQPAERVVGELLAQSAGQSVTVVRKLEEYTVKTLEELRADPALDPQDELRVVRQPFGLQSTTVGELMMGNTAEGEDIVFYVRTVRSTDRQGIWGIVQSGLLENFARGVALNRGQSVETYQVDIPRDADEMLAGRESSFLGRVIHQKTNETHVYNYAHGRMGLNPDVVQPGQEIVIIQFPAEELVEIYKYFAGKG